MTEGEEQLLVVDAANVIGSRPDGWWRDRAGAARRLLSRLSALGDELPRTVVVLEGAAKGAAAEADSRVEVVAAEGAGDDAIVAVVDSAIRAGTASVTVVTADRGLRERVTALGAKTMGPRQLLERLDTRR
ncbi:NYN domain-containing protein [Nocardia pseudobrasiliensis]|uniref:Putative RNA-binding protein with PIN domain n=1 Tax=Nocardia pseudobrasiliensis TaxID=45979 RepID=A0A370I4A2_9NOCA|nr:NYN domain-containing protein [Nocardia pseudobrasiliensis]RDI65515.1 putative RNA-binding protein with PIN domain [Nocardia pseudobrasiliensis]